MSAFRAVLGTLLTVVVYDVVLRWLFHTPDPLTIFSVLLGTLTSLFFWLSIAQLRNLLPRILQFLLAGLIAIAMSALLVANFFTFWKLGDFVNAYMLMFISVDKGFVEDQIRLYGLNWKTLAVVPIFLVFFFLWKPSRAQVPVKIWKSVLLAILFLAAGLVTLNQVKYETVGQHKWVDTSFFLAIKNYQKSTRLNVLRASVRTSVPRLEDARKPDILMFVGESFGKQYMKLYGHPEDSSPSMTRVFSNDRGVVLNRNLSNSSCTDVSLPSLFSGVGPEESDLKLHEMPLIWDWLKSAGYQTIFASPQKFAFANFDAFILSPGPDAYLSADRFMGLGNFIAAHNNGLDDIWAAKKTAEKIRETPREKPILLIFFTNATHYPFLQTSTELKNQPAFKTLYQNSLAITDEAFDVLLKAFQQNRDEKKLMIVSTADHGELEVHSRGVPRIASFYDEILGIPLLFRLPEEKGLIKEGCEKGIRENRESLVQNLDLLPTLLEMIGFADSDSHRDLFSKFQGRSLCHPVSNDRILVGLDTNNIRQWNPEGFLLAKDNSRLVFTNAEGMMFFDLKTDLAERKDLFPKMDPAILGEFDQKIRSNLQLTRLQDLYFPEGLIEHQKKSSVPKN